MTPLRFRPIFQPRVWGGRALERLFDRPLPADGRPYGESWEIVDRPEAQSVVDGGPFHGMSLHDLWTAHRESIFGATAPESDRFPLLLKILDAREDLSLQVHPPVGIASALGGEPKTEMWYVAEAAAGAVLFAGVKPGVTAEAFGAALENGTAAELVPRLHPRSGDFIFIPSGRLHAIGGGLVIFEIQQNSDTTYRVFDWNRLGLDGKPRPLHISESLQCIDFTDAAPAFGIPQGEMLVECPFFRVASLSIPPAGSRTIGKPGEFAMVVVINGSGHLASVPLRPGDHVMLPAMADDRTLTTTSGIRVLQVNFGTA
ncbi:MAG: class I mannose-6-phosphate isomerase [Verrucomicrobiales bacterium]|nr:class I mannose-6-phosphate isomerase [Verrucomicrobiales bacterium]